MWQSFLFLFLAIVIGLFFFLVVIPASINFFFKIMDSGEVVVSENKIPPQVPIVSAPAEAVKDNPLILTGFAQVDDEVVLILNGVEDSRQKIDDSGEFEFSVKLDAGENTLSVYAINEAGLESAVSKEYKVTFDNQVPEIRVESPAANTEFVGRDNQNITINGFAEPKAKIYVNGRLNFANSEGEFKVTHRLEEGENKIELKAIDEAGNESLSELLVSFRY